MAASPRKRPGWSRTFAALRYPNYRLWFFGQMVSLFGTWMQSTAQGFLVFQLTGSPAFLGYVGFASGIPTWLFTLYGGVIADRMSRRSLLLVTQTAMMALAAVLAVLAFLGWVRPAHILLLAFGLGLANAFDAPARLALVPELVEREDLTNAIALNAIMFNTATATGPALAGLTYALFGPAWCFTLNAISFLAVIAALLLIKLAPQPVPVQRGHAARELMHGLRYVLGEPMIRTLIALVAVTSAFGIAFATLLPAWAVRILGGDARTNGWLMSARGLGALVSALFIASLGRFKFKGRLLTIGTFAFPTSLLIFASVRWLPLSLFVLVGVGIAVILIMNLANALVQTQVVDEFRGRVMGLYSLIFFGLMPVGALWIGAAAERFGEAIALRIGASIALGFAALLWAIAPRLRALE